MLNSTQLMLAVANRGFTVKRIAETMQIGRSTFYRKMQTKTGSFTVEEAKQISDMLQLTESEFKAIFLA